MEWREAVQPLLFASEEEPATAGRAVTGRTVAGIAVPYRSLSHDLGGFVEEMDPRAFAEQERAGFPDVELRYAHQAPILLASTRSGSMRIRSTPRGLTYEAQLPASTGYLHELITRGDLRGASIGFEVDENTWSMRDGRAHRLVTKAHLIEISLVGRPAYPDTSAALRSTPANSPSAPRRRMSPEIARARFRLVRSHDVAAEQARRALNR